MEPRPKGLPREILVQPTNRILHHLILDSGRTRTLSRVGGSIFFAIAFALTQQTADARPLEQAITPVRTPSVSLPSPTPARTPTPIRTPTPSVEQLIGTVTTLQATDSRDRILTNNRISRLEEDLHRRTIAEVIGTLVLGTTAALLLYKPISSRLHRKLYSLNYFARRRKQAGLDKLDEIIQMPFGVPHKPLKNILSPQLESPLGYLSAFLRRKLYTPTEPGDPMSDITPTLQLSSFMEGVFRGMDRRMQHDPNNTVFKIELADNPIEKSEAGFLRPGVLSGIKEHAEANGRAFVIITSSPNVVKMARGLGIRVEKTQKQ